MRNAHHPLVGTSRLPVQSAQGTDADTMGFYDPMSGFLPRANNLTNTNVEPNPQQFDAVGNGPNTPLTTQGVVQPVQLVWGGGDRGGRS